MVLDKIPTFQEVKDWAASKTTVDNHINDTNNPHNVNADAPVDDVNGQTGSVNLNYNDVGAKADSYSAPVDSVNGQTGSVSVNTPTLVATGTWSNTNNMKYVSTGLKSLYDDTQTKAILYSVSDVGDPYAVYDVDSNSHYTIAISNSNQSDGYLEEVEYKVFEY